MNKYEFAHTERARRFLSRIEEALVTICQKEEHEADELIRQYWKGISDIESDPLIYSEPPYYYAMCIAHHPRFGDGNMNWAQDSRYWPPPDGWRLG